MTPQVCSVTDKKEDNTLEQTQEANLQTEDAEDQSNTACTNKKPLNMSKGAQLLRSWLNKTFRVAMTDGRILIGIFLCTDRDANVILGSCSEYLSVEAELANEEPRMLGLVMIPGRHIVSVHIDTNNQYTNDATSFPTYCDSTM